MRPDPRRTQRRALSPSRRCGFIFGNWNCDEYITRKILEPAYKPCRGFAGTCAAMRWCPSEGHVPRGCYGALGEVSDVRLVMVLAEPGSPGKEEVHTGMISAFEYAARCYLEDGGQGHRNVRAIIGRCFPGLPLRQAMRKVWITESVLCSAESALAQIDRGIEEECVKRYLLPQLTLFPNAIVAAMGGKAYRRLRRFSRFIPNLGEYGAVYPPGCNFPTTQEKMGSTRG